MRMYFFFLDVSNRVPVKSARDRDYNARIMKYLFLVQMIAQTKQAATATMVTAHQASRCDNRTRKINRKQGEYWLLNESPKIMHTIVHPSTVICSTSSALKMQSSFIWQTTTWQQKTKEIKCKHIIYEVRAEIKKQETLAHTHKKCKNTIERKKKKKGSRETRWCTPHLTMWVQRYGIIAIIIINVNNFIYCVELY